MNSLRVKGLLYVVSMFLMKASCTFVNFQPTQFNYDRYRRSRAWPRGRSLDPVTEFNQALDFMALVNQFGYQAEEHLVTTIDGYKLRLHRIPGSPSIPKARGKPVVYFQHGIFLSSDSWVLRGPNKDFAYILADAGFDVWFGNARGNTYSRGHVSLSPDHDAEFWNFSWHEIALYDISRMIDYILAETGRERLVYVGHSMGTSMSYVLLSTRPEYNERLELVISMAPVAFWRGNPSPFLRFISNHSKVIKDFVYRLQMHEIFPRTDAYLQVIQTSCTATSPVQPICLNIISVVLGRNPKELNTTMVPYYLSYFLSGASRKTLLHYEQNLLSGDFQMYDYGIEKNLLYYNSKNPPHYNLNNVVAPVALFYGKGDALVSNEDPLELARKLPNVLTVEAVPDEQFSHVDFLFGNHLKTLLLDRIIEIITKVTRNENAL